MGHNHGVEGIPRPGQVEAEGMEELKGFERGRWKGRASCGVGTLWKMDLRDSMNNCEMKNKFVECRTKKCYIASSTVSTTRPSRAAPARTACNDDKVEDPHDLEQCEDIDHSSTSHSNSSHRMPANPRIPDATSWTISQNSLSS